MTLNQATVTKPRIPSAARVLAAFHWRRTKAEQSNGNKRTRSSGRNPAAMPSRAADQYNQRGVSGERHACQTQSATAIAPAARKVRTWLPMPASQKEG